jgi:hypothetical protein
MIALDTAKEMVIKEVNSAYSVPGDSLVLLEEFTIEKDYGWIFFYESQRWLTTGNFSDQVLGNAPILVEKQTGNLHYFGTAYSVEEYIREYELMKQ